MLTIWLHQFIRFFGVGLIATGLHYLVMVLLVTGLGVNPVPAAALGSLAGAVLSYFLNYRFTFASTGPRTTTALKFGLVAGSGMLLNVALVSLFVEWAGLHYLLAQVITTGILLCWNFAINKIWTFKEC